VAQTARSSTPAEMLKSPVFWILYVMFVMVSASGLMATAQIALIARDFHVANVAILGGATALSVALIIDNVANGAARPLFGWVSDHIGRENTMAIVFAVGAGAYWALGTIGTTPWAFIATAGMVYFTWGEIYSLFPAICTDAYGSKYATTNAGFLYTAKGTAAFVVPAASWLQTYTGSWHTVFMIAAATNIAVGATALLVVKPLRTAQALRTAALTAPAGAR
jgi:OFA family oxalate/formate antiporter-like MFS transporter